MTPNLNKMKMDLEKRVGEALGVKESDYANAAEYGAALKLAVAGIRRERNADAIIAGIEKDLGLDKLGISLETVINAITEPNGDDDKRLDAALEKFVGAKKKPVSSGSTTLDEVGIYQLRS